MRFIHLMAAVTFYLTILANQIFAGGLHCHYCPPENNVCVPRPNCRSFDGNERTPNGKFDEGDERVESQNTYPHDCAAPSPK